MKVGILASNVSEITKGCWEDGPHSPALYLQHAFQSLALLKQNPVSHQKMLSADSAIPHLLFSFLVLLNLQGVNNGFTVGVE